MLRRASIAGLTASLSCGLALAAVPAIGGPAPIIEGAPSSIAAVGALLDVDGGVACTGTWIGGRMVLTAGHCVASGALASFFTGPALDGPGERVAVIGTAAHPGFELSSLAADVGLVVLERPLDGDGLGAPAVLAGSPPDVGEPLRFVGYGWSGVSIGAEDGVRLERETEVTAVSADRFRYGVATCYGDSGGPAFAAVDRDGHPVAVGVTSSGDAACATHGVDARVDVYRAWLADTAAACDGEGERETCPVAWSPRPPEEGGCRAGPAHRSFPAVPALLLFLAALAPLRRRSRTTPALTAATRR